MKLIVSIQLVFILCWTACSNSQQSTSDVPKKEISDSLFYRYYLEGKYEKLVESNYKLDSDLKQGLYSAALSDLGRFKEAKEAIPHYDEIEFDQYASGEKQYPLEYPKSMGPFEVFAVYKYGFLTGEMSESGRSFALDFMLKLDPTNILTKMYRRYDSMVRYSVIFPDIKPLLDSLEREYPYWKRLQDMRAKYYAVDSNYDSSLIIRKKLLREGFKADKQIEEIIMTYLKTNKTDSIRRYISMFENKFPQDCCVPAVIYYKRQGQYNKMLKTVQPCLNQEMLPKDEKEIVDVFYLEGLIQEGKYQQAEEYLPESKKYVHSNWEESKQFEVELRLLLHQGEYEEYRELIEGGYGDYLCRNCQNPLKQMTKAFYEKNPEVFDRSFEDIYEAVQNATP